MPQAKNLTEMHNAVPVVKSLKVQRWQVINVAVRMKKLLSPLLVVMDGAVLWVKNLMGMRNAVQRLNLLERLAYNNVVLWVKHLIQMQMAMVVAVKRVKYGMIPNNNVLLLCVRMEP